MTNNNKKPSLTNFPLGRLTPFSYLLAFLFLLSAKISNKILVLNLPYEIGHPCELKPPYLYNHYQEGINFIEFVEKIKKILYIKVFWQTSDYFSSIPNDISLLLNLDKFPKKTKRLTRFCQERKKQIKMILSKGKQLIRLDKRCL